MIFTGGCCYSFPRRGDQEDDMKAISLVAALLLAAAPQALAESTVPAGSVCLATNQIDYTSVVSDQIIRFHMTNGKIWTNTLKSTCHGLKFDGAFSQEIRGGEICSNMQMIRVLTTGTPCMLGDFTRYTPPPKVQKTD
jgi:hypothetical protein